MPSNGPHRPQQDPCLGFRGARAPLTLAPSGATLPRMTPATQPRSEPLDDRGSPDLVRDALLREIAEDARREPERFLDDSRVPEGGE